MKKTKRVLALLLSFALAFPHQAYAQSNAETEVLKEGVTDGVSEADFTISSAKEFMNFDWGNVKSGQLVQLTDNIELEDDWKGAAVFHGTFDGLGHSIDNLKGSRGLFDELGSDGIVKNLCVDVNLYISDGESYDEYAIGAIASVNYGLIDSVHVSSYDHGIFIKAEHAGGVAGVNETSGTIQNSYFEGYIERSGSEDSVLPGGIAGTNKGHIYNSCNLGRVNGAFPMDFKFQIAGQDLSEGGIENCYSKSSVDDNMDELMKTLNSNRKKGWLEWVTLGAHSLNNYVSDPYPVPFHQLHIDTCITHLTDGWSYIYTGEEIKPAITVSGDARSLEENKDYKLVYRDNINAGTGYAELYGLGRYRGSVTLTFDIHSKSIEEIAQPFSGFEVTKNGTVVPKLSLAYNGIPLVLNKDYHMDEEVMEYKLANGDPADGFCYSIYGEGNFSDEFSFYYFADGTSISGAAVGFRNSPYYNTYTYEYTGEQICPDLGVWLLDKALVSGVDYEVTYANNIEMGIAKAIITGRGKFTGSTEVPFVIRGDGHFKDMRKANVSFGSDCDVSEYIPKTQNRTPSIIVKYENETLKAGTDYTVQYRNNTATGRAYVYVIGKGDYYGITEKSFRLFLTDQPVQTDISKAAVTLAKTSYTYDGTAKTPAVTVKMGEKTLTPHTDYAVSYKNNIKVGAATVTISGKGSYTGTKSVNFTITAAKKDSSITCKKKIYKVVYGAKPFKINATSESKLTFTSSNPKIASVNKNTGKVTVKGTGIASITIRTEKSSVKVSVKVSPKKQSLKSIKVSKGKKLKVTWAKDKKASGYQVQVSTAKNFKKNMKQKKLTKNTYTFTKLKAGKKYYVRVRSYKKSGKETLYGAWSNRKLSGKVKK